VIDEFRDGNPNATLVAKSEKDASVPLFTRRELAQTLEDRLTDRQAEVLRTAYEAGYYSRPRDITGEEVAERLDISVATFSQHLRVAERTLVGILVDEGLV
jgi:predicted DNA binding protein